MKKYTIRTALALAVVFAALVANGVRTQLRDQNLPEE